ncbi:unnamed protein product [Adineta steineri]|uniref:CRAL-TRIO domain-containing protein n=1 Tax=Adineta steineri TaxID=433720 RepID=A0A815BQH3_9BILA|nr:unnamed protein product [Adineta steineri]
MTANDPGHINNLNKTQKNALKQCWIDLISTISIQTSLPDTCIINSDYGHELFIWIAYESADVVLLRWLRANKWDIKITIQRIMNLLTWRIKSRIQEFLSKAESEISLEEATMNKGYFMGYDKIGRPVCYIHAKEHIRGQFSLDQTEKLAILALEISRKLLQSPVETFTVVIDVGGISRKNMDLHLAKNFINLFQTYYSESLGLGLIVNGSWFFNSCWSIIMPWLDPTVENKIKFIKKETDLNMYIDPINIPQRLQGKHEDFQYILPTEKDQTMLTAFRHDNQGKKFAETHHRQVAKKYLKLTLRWAHTEDNENFILERIKASKNLTDTYEKLLPYITTQIHYHRNGDINENIFDMTYNKLCTNDTDIEYF